jgi:hypothetical protein
MRPPLVGVRNLLRRQPTKIAHFLVATFGLDSCLLSHVLVRFVLELLLDRSCLCRSRLLGGRLLGGSRLRLLGHPGWFGLAWSCGTCCTTSAAYCRRLDVEVVALLKRCEALLDRVYFGVFLGCDLAGVDLRGCW